MGGRVGKNKCGDARLRVRSVLGEEGCANGRRRPLGLLASSLALCRCRARAVACCSRSRKLSCSLATKGALAVPATRQPYFLKPPAPHAPRWHARLPGTRSRISGRPGRRSPSCIANSNPASLRGGCDSPPTGAARATHGDRNERRPARWAVRPQRASVKPAASQPVKSAQVGYHCNIRRNPGWIASATIF